MLWFSHWLHQHGYFPYTIIRAQIRSRLGHAELRVRWYDGGHGRCSHDHMLLSLPPSPSPCLPVSLPLPLSGCTIIVLAQLFVAPSSLSIHVSLPLPLSLDAPLLYSLNSSSLPPLYLINGMRNIETLGIYWWSNSPLVCPKYVFP